MVNDNKIALISAWLKGATPDKALEERDLLVFLSKAYGYCNRFSVLHYLTQDDPYTEWNEFKLAYNLQDRQLLNDLKNQYFNPEDRNKRKDLAILEANYQSNIIGQTILENHPQAESELYPEIIKRQPKSNLVLKKNTQRGQKHKEVPNPNNKTFSHWLMEINAITSPISEEEDSPYDAPEPLALEDKKTFFSAPKMASKSNMESKDMITETLVKIWVLQNQLDKAIEGYEHLSLKFPEKKLYFADQINRLKNILKKS